MTVLEAAVGQVFNLSGQLENLCYLVLGVARSFQDDIKHQRMPAPRVGLGYAEIRTASSEVNLTMLGQRLGVWIIDKELGRGGMGCVYLAHLADDAPPSDLPSRAALKVMAPELAVEVGYLLRFQNEIK